MRKRERNKKLWEILTGQGKIKYFYNSSLPSSSSSPLSSSSSSSSSRMRIRRKRGRGIEYSG